MLCIKELLSRTMWHWDVMFAASYGQGSTSGSDIGTSFSEEFVRKQNKSPVTANSYIPSMIADL